MSRHAWIKDPLPVEESPMYFHAIHAKGYEIFTDMVSSSQLQTTFKKLSCLEFWFRIKDELPQLSKETMKNSYLFYLHIWMRPDFLHIFQPKQVKIGCKNPPGGPVVGNLPANAGDTGPIPGQGTKLPPAARQLSLQATTREKISVCLHRQCRHKHPCMFLLRSRVSTSLQQNCLERSAPRKDPTCHNQDPMQPKINKQVFFF